VNSGSPGFVIHRLRREELGRFQAVMPAWNAHEYARRLAFQERGLAVQLVAWAGEEPVGKAMVVYPGHEEWSPSAYREGCPEIRDLEVSRDRLRRGIGTALVGTSEDEARSAGFAKMGLGVGLEPSYAAARSMYERLGYRTAHGPFVAAARLEDDDGRPFPVAGVCVYLVKRLTDGVDQPS
jgi:GNAT superfamily N-acetyltransferase